MVADEPVTLQLICAYEQLDGSVIAIREVEPQLVDRFGIVQTERPNANASGKLVRITGLVEKPSAENALSRVGVFGRYLLDAAIWHVIDQTIGDARGEVQLTDALNSLCRTKPAYGLFFDGEHYDAGNRLGYLKANIELSLQDPSVQQPLRGYLAGLLS
jgi:UTP--glucose-1-phosphate uridylyltransferase